MACLLSFIVLLSKIGGPKLEV